LSPVSPLPDYQDTMPEMPISTQPPSRRDALIQERYLEAIAKHSECMGVLVPQLVTLVVARQMENRRRAVSEAPGNTQASVPAWCWAGVPY